MASDIDPLDAHVGDLSPKAKLVYLVLDREGPLTRQDIMRATRASEATIHRAIVELAEANVVENRPVPTNPAANVYYLRGRESETNV